MQKGDKVKIISTDSDEWFNAETSFAMDLPYFTISEIDAHGNWIKLEELEFRHPIKNFEKI